MYFRIPTARLKSEILNKNSNIYQYSKYIHVDNTTDKKTNNNTHNISITINTRILTKLHIIHLQQYTKNNYSNTHKSTTTIHTRKLHKYPQETKKYKEDNYDNTHNTT